MLSREQELEADLKAIIEYRVEFFQTCEEKIRKVYQQRIEDLERSLKRAQQQISTLSAQSSDQKALANKSYTETSRLQGQLEEVQVLAESLESDKTKALRKIDTLEKKLQEQIKLGKADQGELKKLRHMEPEKKIKQAANAQKEVKELKKQLTESARLARSRKVELDELNKEVASLKEKIEGLESAQQEQSSKKKTKETAAA
ncbi:hypothetical protein [Sansalvadorimonas verongulae]|uniref:hypothetical protein n=1 Tax=Sansalvadorimonas verongulae TaxID=2172824 RepID=UPI0012BB9774|nr:hypothetical protein [Sansalvadorimonas verongulae]MTI14579.1 hypothetical protein [Sansalvadorimonas verongulae]